MPLNFRLTLVAFTIAGTALFALPAKAQSIADTAASQAREAARANRHADAIAGFERAIEAAPERRRDWLIELADQLTWSGKLDDGIRVYREAATSANRDEVRRANIGLARALSRNDQQGLSLHIYQQILRDHPEDKEAKQGASRVLSWRGRYRAAAQQAQSLLKDHPGDREAVAILAESQSWMGRPDRAERTLRTHLANDPDDERAGSLLAELERRQRPEARIDWREFDQSDGLRISEVTVDTRFWYSNGRGYIAPRFVQGIFRPENGPVDRIVVQRPSLSTGYRINDAFDFNASVALDDIDTKRASGDHQRLTYDIYATYRPNDILRFDLGSSRWTFDSEEALRKGLTATQVAGSVDIAPNELTTFSVRISRADYSDGNERKWWQIQASQRLFSNPRIEAGYRYTGFDFKTPGQGGYYNPDRYRTHELLLSASGWLARRLRWNARAVGGRETETPGRTRSTINGGASLTYELRSGLEIETAYDHSSSRTFSAGGFERNIARLTLRFRF